MDDVVLRAMARWPEVPAVHGWLSLDRRGQWRLQGDPIAHEGSIRFIGRNYHADKTGRWYFQNGPQRVYVQLDYLPWVLFMSPNSDVLTTHTGSAAAPSGKFWVDGEGALIIATQAGPGLLYDQDLPRALARMRVQSGADADLERALEHPEQADELGLEIRWHGAWHPVRGIDSHQVASIFGFEPNPRGPAPE